MTSSSSPGLISIPAPLQGLPPVAGPSTRLLLLGSFPGAASLAARQYYGHPRNHFWPILSALWGEPLRDRDYAERIAFIGLRGLGLWDVYASCRREGSLDADIVDPVRNDLAGLVRKLPRLALIAHNGGESARSMRITGPIASALGVPVLKLPSSSPANASWSVERKTEAWRRAFVQAGLL